MDFSKGYKWINLILILVLPIIGILRAEVTVFYILYLYWFQELIVAVLNWIYSRKNKDTTTLQVPRSLILYNLFTLGIYLVFIIVIFGFMANWGQTDLIIQNILIISFGSQMFNLNLLGILLNEWTSRQFINTTSRTIKENYPMSGKLLVLHVGIIFGGVAYFFIVKRFPETFTPTNLWGAVLIAAPFLILRTIYAWRQPEK